MDGAIIVVIAAFAVVFLILGALFLHWKPTDDWHLFYRKYSTWLAGANAILWANLLNQQDQLMGFTTYVPVRWKPVAVMAVLIVGWLAPVVVAHIKQEKLDALKQTQNDGS